MHVFFDVQHLYYMPQYEPVITELTQLDCQVTCVFYQHDDALLIAHAQRLSKEYGFELHWLQQTSDALRFYQHSDADWIIFGNAFAQCEALNQTKKTALMQHGIGPKQCYYDVSENVTTARFVEGAYRKQRLDTLFPSGNFIDTGYAKLDPILREGYRAITPSNYGLDNDKPTLLYAPTFYPSSIEKFSIKFAQEFSDYNIIIKPHFFSLTKKSYRKHQKIMQHWAKSDNVYLASVDEVNLVPFLCVADVLLSDASSAIFEFAALDKPVIWCDFYQLRWSYRGPFAYRFKARLDDDIAYFHSMCYRAGSYYDIHAQLLLAQVEAPEFKRQRADIVTKLAGNLDGFASRRIAHYLLENK